LLEKLRRIYAENDRSKIVELIYEKEIDSKAEQLLREFTLKAYRELDKLESLKMKLSLYTVLGKIF